jgi:hypothetical protein
MAFVGTFVGAGVGWVIDAGLAKLGNAALTLAVRAGQVGYAGYGVVDGFSNGRPFSAGVAIGTLAYGLASGDGGESNAASGETGDGGSVGSADDALGKAALDRHEQQLRDVGALSGDFDVEYKPGLGGGTCKNVGCETGGLESWRTFETQAEFDKFLSENPRNTELRAVHVGKGKAFVFRNGVFRPGPDGPALRPGNVIEHTILHEYGHHLGFGVGGAADSQADEFADMWMRKLGR